MTYSLAFFLGPGLARALAAAAPSPLPFMAAAFRLTPFFLGASAGGPMGSWGTGVLLPAGVLGDESDAFSVLAVGKAGSVAEVAGDSLAGDSSLTGAVAVAVALALALTLALALAGSRTACSRTTETFIVTRPGRSAALSAALSAFSDLRRSLAAAAALLAGGMATTATAVAVVMGGVQCRPGGEIAASGGGRVVRKVRTGRILYARGHLGKISWGKVPDRARSRY